MKAMEFGVKFGLIPSTTHVTKSVTSQNGNIPNLDPVNKVLMSMLLWFICPSLLIIEQRANQIQNFKTASNRPTKLNCSCV